MDEAGDAWELDFPIDYVRRQRAYSAITEGSTGAIELHPARRPNTVA
jgi:hypothetical protein